MSDLYKKFLDANHDPVNTYASLEIFVDEDGVLHYNCDWIKGEEGIVSIASIFQKLLVDNLTFEILEEIKSQCVTNNREGEYINLINIIQNTCEQSLYKTDKPEDDVVIPPDQVFNI
jgi:hypothetical protein